jgi:hypothetical protein
MLKRVIQILAQVAPPEFVYHATPYVDEILSGGFEIDPERQMLGGHGTYISTTTLENATTYAKALVVPVSIMNGDLDWVGLRDTIESWGFGDEFMQSFQSVFNDRFLFFGKKPREVMLDAHENYGGVSLEWFWHLADSGIDFDGQPFDARTNKELMWRVFKYINRDWGDAVPLFLGPPPWHLENRNTNDIGVLEVAIAPVEAYSEHGYVGVPTEPKGKFTYNPSEYEWRFYDPTDLLPVRRVARAVSNSTVINLSFQQTP